MSNYLRSMLGGMLVWVMASTAYAVAVPQAEHFTVDPDYRSTGEVSLCNTVGDTRTCHRLTELARGEACTDRSLLGTIRQGGGQGLLEPGLQISAVEDLVARLNETRNRSVSGNYFHCTEYGEDFWSVGVMCLDTIPADGIFEYDICIRSMTKITELSVSALARQEQELANDQASNDDPMRVDLLPEDDETGEPPVPAPGMEEVSGPVQHNENDGVITLRYGDEADHRLLNLRAGEANSQRAPACRTSELRKLFTSTPADLGDGDMPAANFEDLYAEMDEDQNGKAYAWFAPCDHRGDTVRGLLCVDPGYSLDRGIYLKACAYARGSTN